MNKPTAKANKLSISLDMEVAFFDVDSYRIVWHGNYPKYFEIARCKLLEHINFTYEDMEAAGYFFPIIDMKTKYIKPLLFKQQFTITATLVEWENKLTINYLIQDRDTGEKITKAETSQVAIAMPEQITQFASPEILINKVKTAIKAQYERNIT